MWKSITERQKTIITDFQHSLGEEGFYVKDFLLTSFDRRFFNQHLLLYSIKFLINDNIEYISSLEINSYIYFYKYKDSVCTNKYYDICNLVTDNHHHLFSASYSNEKEFLEEILECNYGDACGKIEEQLDKLKTIILSYPHVHKFLDDYDVKNQEIIIKDLGL